MCIVMCNSCCVDRMGPIKEVVEVDALSICEGINQYVGIGGFLFKLLGDPFQSAALDMIMCAKSVVVPYSELVFLLVEDV